MALPNPEHLLEQAEQLVGLAASGRPREIDLRRAVSNAYYAVFHAVLIAAADNAIGRGARTSAAYRLVYRSVDHRSLRELCKEAQKTIPAAKYRRYVPQDGFHPEIRAFAAAVIDLQIRREEADYDPLATLKREDARLVIKFGREALHQLEAAPRADRDAFLNLLLFSPR